MIMLNESYINLLAYVNNIVLIGKEKNTVVDLDSTWRSVGNNQITYTIGIGCNIL